MVLFVLFFIVVVLVGFAEIGAIFDATVLIEQRIPALVRARTVA